MYLFLTFFCSLYYLFCSQNDYKITYFGIKLAIILQFSMILCKLFTYFFIFLNDCSFVAVCNIIIYRMYKKE